MLISVIVPVYNVEDYLHYAVESLINQTYKDFEVILVDDGSTDNSGDKCEYYANKYDNMYVYHRTNGGLSDARNFGVKKAKGEFITFLDPDDYLEPYALELMKELSDKYIADIVSTKVETTLVYNDYSGKLCLNKADLTNVKVFKKEDALIEMYNDKYATVSACGKLYKKDILLKHPFPIGKIYEDLYIVSEHLASANNIVLSTDKSYKYYKREGSIVNTTFTKKKLDFYTAIDHNRDIIHKSYDKKKTVTEALEAKKIMGSYSIVNSAIDSQCIKEIKLIKEYMRISLFSDLKNPRLSIKSKIKYLILVFSPRLYIRLRENIKKSK